MAGAEAVEWAVSENLNGKPNLRPTSAERGLEGMRDVLRGSLGESLRGMSEEDRLAAAWTVACGPALAGRGTIAGYDRGVVLVTVEEAVWMAQMISLRGALARQMQQAAGLPVERIEFELRNWGRR